MIRLEKLPLPVRVNELWRHRYQPKSVRLRKERWIEAVHKQLGGRPEPMLGPLQVSLTWAPRDRRIADCDAWCKSAFDWLEQAGVYENDSQIDSFTCQRLPTPEHPGWITIEVWEIPG